MKFGSWTYDGYTVSIAIRINQLVQLRILILRREYKLCLSNIRTKII